MDCRFGALWDSISWAKKRGGKICKLCQRSRLASASKFCPKGLSYRLSTSRNRSCFHIPSKSTAAEWSCRIFESLKILKFCKFWGFVKKMRFSSVWQRLGTIKTDNFSTFLRNRWLQIGDTGFSKNYKFWNFAKSLGMSQKPLDFCPYNRDSA